MLLRRQVRLAYAIAISADVLQLLLGPLGWVGVDEIIDVAAMILLVWLLGFHPLLLPTFVLELLPVTDLLPTWTGCVALVVAMKRRTGTVAPIPSPDRSQPPHSSGPIIDV